MHDIQSGSHDPMEEFAIEQHFQRAGTFMRYSHGIGELLNSNEMRRAMEEVAKRIQNRAEELAFAEIYSVEAVRQRQARTRERRREEYRNSRSNPDSAVSRREGAVGRALLPPKRNRQRRPVEAVERKHYINSFGIRSHRNGGATHDRAEAILYNDAPSAIYVEFGHRGKEPFHIMKRAAFGPLAGG